MGMHPGALNGPIKIFFSTRLRWHMQYVITARADSGQDLLILRRKDVVLKSAL